MRRGLQGYLLPSGASTGEVFRAFVPRPLPPDPPIVRDLVLDGLMDEANRAIGRLDGVSLLLPDVSLFLYFYVRKEAVVSSQIEGTQSSLSDLLLFESNDRPGVPLDDVREVSSYVAALNHGLHELETGTILSVRLIRDMHAILLRHGRGADKQPGEFRTSQNWVGGTRPGNALYVPPPPHEVRSLMGDLERFLHEQPHTTPPLVKAALAHVQFETIHPFLDGNGRLGRLLITLLLCHYKVLHQPLLYLSLFFKTRRARYYELLQDTRTHGEWEEWLGFFLEGVKETADQAAHTARRILDLFEEDRLAIEAIGRAANTALRVHHLLQRRPAISIRDIVLGAGVSKPTAASALQHLHQLGIVQQLPGRRRKRIFVYERYLSILSEGTEPLP